MSARKRERAKLQPTSYPMLFVMLPALCVIWTLVALSFRSDIVAAPPPPAPSPPPAPLLSPIFSPQVHYWAERIAAWSAEFDLDPDIAATIMQIESCGDPGAISPAGAQGLFQVMPYHFADGENMLDPDTNARRGLAYFVERMAQTNGDIGRSFAGYNGGHVAAANEWHSWAYETQRYYVWSTGIYGEAKAGHSESETLTAWLNAGGSSLCRQASRRLGLND